MSTMHIDCFTFQYYSSKQNQECIFDLKFIFLSGRQIFIVSCVERTQGDRFNAIFKIDVPVAEPNPSCAGPSGMGIFTFSDIQPCVPP